MKKDEDTAAHVDALAEYIEGVGPLKISVEYDYEDKGFPRVVISEEDGHMIAHGATLNDALTAFAAWFETEYPEVP